MDKTTLVKSLENCVKKNSRYEVKRNYLSMSRIGECPRLLYFEYINGAMPDYKNYSGAFLGYTFEDIIANWLINDLKIIDPATRNLELSAFGGRFKGHIDGLTDSRILVEIKSVNKRKFELIKQDINVPQTNFLQVQTYMYHGYFQEAIIFYVCRETMHFDLKRLKCMPMIGQRMTEKAKMILHAIDEQKPPRCICGYCQ